jgi:small subunit ribosomal protein S16
MGAKKRPFYRVVVKEKRSKRDGKYLENLGTYDPLADPADVKLNHDRIQYWIGVGAQPSETVASLIKANPVMSDEEREAMMAARAEKKAAAEAARAEAKRIEAERIAAEKAEADKAAAEAEAAQAAEAAPAEEVAAETTTETAPAVEVTEAPAAEEAVEASPTEEAAPAEVADAEPATEKGEEGEAAA